MSTRLAKIGYAAYAEALKGKTKAHGLRLDVPTWEELPPGLRAAWEASAQATGSAVLQSMTAGVQKGSAG